MKTQDLKEYLSGRKPLNEMGFNSPGGAANTGLPPMWTGRQEKLANAWQDILVQMEALALDILDLSQQVYAQILPLLKDIRASRGESCHENLPRFNALIQILSQHTDKGEQMPLFISRMQHLYQELTYVCEELAPRDSRVPEAPARRKDDWLSQKTGMKKPEMTFSAPGGAEDRWESAFRNELKSGTILSDSKNPLAQPPTCPSLAMASLGTAADSISESRGDLDVAFKRAGDAISLCLEQYTDAQTAAVEISGTAPGSFPRLEVTCTWGDSPYVGKTSLYWSENGKDRALVIEGKSDGLVRMSENLTDQQVAERIYNCLDTVYDFNPRANSEASVVPTLYRLIGRYQRGENVQPYQVEQVLESLRSRIGLSESVGLVAEKINLQCESISAIEWAWYYTWEHEYVSPNSMFAASDGVFAPTGEDPGSDVVNVTEGALMKAWQTPRIVINLESAEVYLADEDDKEVLPKDAKDEDVTAKLLTMTNQKESLTRGKVIEQWQDTLRQEVSELVEGMTLSNQREKGKITPTSGAIKEYRAEPGSLTKACYAAAAYAKRDSKEYVVVPGNSMMQRVYHVAPQSDGLSKFGILSGTTVQVMLVKPDGSLFQCDAVGAPLKNESTLGEGWEQPFRDSLSEVELTWDPREHPRDTNTGEFIDHASATRTHKRAAHRAYQKMSKHADTPKEEIPTHREPIKPSRSKYDPQQPKAETPPQVEPSTATSEPKSPPAKEPDKTPEIPSEKEPVKEPAPEAQPPAPEQPQVVQQPPQTPPPPIPGTPQPVPVLDPMTGQPMVDPMTGQPVMQFVNPLVPGAPEPRLPTPPKKGKQLPQDQPYKPKEGEAPNLPVPPTSEPVKQPRLGEPLKVKPPVPSAPPKSTYSRRNPDLDAAFGMAPPEGEQPPQAPPAEAPKAGEQPKAAAPKPTADPEVDNAREADVAQEVMNDPELAELAKELGISDDPDSDPDVQAFTKIVNEAPQTNDPKDTEAYLKQRQEELATHAGRVARKTYAKDLKKAKRWVDNLPAGDPNTPKDAKERLDLIRAKAKELQDERVENFKKMLAGFAWLATMAGGVVADALDKIIHASTEVYQDPGNPYAQM